MKHDLKIIFSGLIRSPASWAVISRHLLKYLSRLKIPVRLVPKRGFLYDSGFQTSDEIERLVGAEISPEDAVSLCFDHPRFFKHLSGRLKAALLVYETFPLPHEWAEAINSHLNVVFVPNDFNRDIFVRSGVRPEKIRVVPYGFDPSLLNVARHRPRRLFAPKKYLTIAMPHKRKGLSLLVKCFCRAFTAKDGVSLMVKTTYRPKPRKQRLPWETEDAESIIARARRRFPDPPAITCVSRAFSDEEMASLYASHDVYLQTSFAEGYGLAVLEAMASGMPCIVTGSGGHMDFCDKRTALLAPFKIRQRTGMAYDMALSGNKIPVAVPDEDAMARLLRFSHAQPLAMRRMALAARRRVSALTWENAACLLTDSLINIQKTLDTTCNKEHNCNYFSAPFPGGKSSEDRNGQ